MRMMFYQQISVSGLPSRSVFTPALGGPTVEWSCHHRGSGSQWSSSGSSHLETRSIFPQCQRRRVSIRYSSKCVAQDWTQWTDSIHAKVDLNFFTCEIVKFLLKVPPGPQRLPTQIIGTNYQRVSKLDQRTCWDTRDVHMFEAAFKGWFMHAPSADRLSTSYLWWAILGLFSKCKYQNRSEIRCVHVPKQMK